MNLINHPIEQQARAWLFQHGIHHPQLTRLSGYTNHVFRVEQGGHASVLRMADHSLGGGLCPLAEQSQRVIGLHRDAVELGLAPQLLAADEQAGIMWLHDAGEQRLIHPADFPSICAQLQRLHHSGLDWRVEGATVDVASLRHLQRLAEGADAEVQVMAEHLLRAGQARGYADYPLVPVHSDLNPGNWLHDGERWWLIDWDYAGMKVAEWDYASLIVEHGWGREQAAALAPEVGADDLAWFCGSFALLSWAWHVQRGTAVVGEKRQVVAYWCGGAKLSLT